MFQVNDNYLKLPGSYLFSTIAKKVNAYSKANPDKKVIRLGIGDVTLPIAPAIIDAFHGAVDEMGKAETFRGYAPDLGYEFLRNAIAENDYKARGCDIEADEIFISDGAKCDSGNIQEIFSVDNRIAVCDPVYPVYVDTNVMAGRAGTYDARKGTWSNVIYMPCLEENDFVPELPEETPDIIYLCFPNNPTGAAVTKERLQEWVDYANRTGLRSSMTLLMRLIFPRKVCPIRFMNARGENVRDRTPFFFQECRFYGGAPWVYGDSERTEVRGCLAPFPLGEKAWNQI